MASSLATHALATHTPSFEAGIIASCDARQPHPGQDEQDAPAEASAIVVTRLERSAKSHSADLISAALDQKLN